MTIDSNLVVGVGLDLALRLGLVDDEQRQHVGDVATRHLAAWCYGVGQRQHKPFRRGRAPAKGKHARRRAARYIRQARRKRLRALARMLTP